MVATFTKTGNKATSPAKLDKAVFGIPSKNYELLKAAYVAYLANDRSNNARTKTRGEVSGGGRKPWRQKGTGRARFGSSRNPIWRGGGITFGPTGNENYTHKLTTNAKRQAVKQALSMAADNNRLIVIEDLATSNSKTSDMAKLLTKIGAKKHTLVVVADKTAELDRALSNLPYVKLIRATYINAYDALNADMIVVTTEALKHISNRLAPKARASSITKEIKS